MRPQLLTPIKYTPTPPRFRHCRGQKARRHAGPQRQATRPRLSPLFALPTRPHSVPSEAAGSPGLAEGRARRGLGQPLAVVTAGAEEAPSPTPRPPRPGTGSTPPAPAPPARPLPPWAQTAPTRSHSPPGRGQQRLPPPSGRPRGRRSSAAPPPPPTAPHARQRPPPASTCRPTRCGRGRGGAGAARPLPPSAGAEEQRGAGCRGWDLSAAGGPGRAREADSRRAAPPARVTNERGGPSCGAPPSGRCVAVTGSALRGINGKDKGDADRAVSTAGEARDKS